MLESSVYFARKLLRKTRAYGVRREWEYKDGLARDVKFYWSASHYSISNTAEKVWTCTHEPIEANVRSVV